MKILKYIFFFLLIAIVVGAIYLATLDGSYDVKRSRIIKANPTVIFNELNDFKNWKDWGPWYEEDPSIVAIYDAKTSGEGASYSWTSKEGEGSMRTVKVEEPTKINQEIIFKVPIFGNMQSEVNWFLEKVKGGTKVTWEMKGELGFFSRFMAKSMEDQIGPMEVRGLELLDQNIQKDIKKYSITNDGVVDYGGGYYLYTTTSSKIDEIGDKFAPMLMKVGAYLKANNIRKTGGPFTLYHKYDEENGTSMFSVCYPVAEKIITPNGSDILTGFMKNGKYFKTTLKGSYDNSEEAWKKAWEDVEKLDGYKAVEDGEPFEVYVNSPMTTPNPADLITEIYIPVKKL